MTLDAIDLEILKLLTQNAKLSAKEIGEKIHLTGQAVGVRINKLVSEGVIEAFTVQINKEKLGIKILALIIILMKTNEHAKLKKIIESNEAVTEAHRISGEGCYFLRVETPSHEVLNALLDEINTFANYQLSLSIAKLK
jgi:Lrp/AsnC family leucine-responsive transcriptional regulator